MHLLTTHFPTINIFLLRQCKETNPLAGTRWRRRTGTGARARKVRWKNTTNRIAHQRAWRLRSLSRKLMLVPHLIKLWWIAASPLWTLRYLLVAYKLFRLFIPFSYLYFDCNVWLHNRGLQWLDVSAVGSDERHFACVLLNNRVYWLYEEASARVRFERSDLYYHQSETGPYDWWVTQFMGLISSAWYFLFYFVLLISVGFENGEIKIWLLSQSSLSSLRGIYNNQAKISIPPIQLLVQLQAHASGVLAGNVKCICQQ